jgi:hypothetical protein
MAPIRQRRYGQPCRTLWALQAQMPGGTEAVNAFRNAGEGLRPHYSACRFPELAHPVTLGSSKSGTYIGRTGPTTRKCNLLQMSGANPASLEEFGRIRQKVTSDSKAHFSGVKLDSLSFRCLSNYFTFNQSDCGVWPSPRCSQGRALSLFLS